MRRSFLVVAIVVLAAVTLGAECQKSGEGGTPENTAPKQGSSPDSDWTTLTNEADWEAPRPFSNSTECKFCHPRQYQEWRSSPHSYTGISPTFYSLVAAGQNFGAGVMIDQTRLDTLFPGNGIVQEEGAALAGGVGNFCQPCHAPMGFVGLEGRYGGNNDGFANVEPIFAFVCNTAAGINVFQPCTNETSDVDCESSAGAADGAGRCVQFEGRTCINAPPATGGNLFPRQLIQCQLDSDCQGLGIGCEGDDCGPCVLGPTTSFYHPEAQEGINCEACHNVTPNHQRSCQLFRRSDSTGVLSITLEERETDDGRRLRLGPYPLESVNGEAGGESIPGAPLDPEEGVFNDTIPPVANAFHESGRVETPLTVPYENTDWAFGTPNFANDNVQIVRPTALSCEELPYCRNGICEGGLYIGAPCPGGDFDCGGCGSGGTCGPGPGGPFPVNPTAGNACWSSIDCGLPPAGDEDENLLVRGTADETVPPLTARFVTGGPEIDRVDGNYYRSSMFCATCHDVRPPFFNTTLRACQEQPSQVCATDADCAGLGIGCSGDDCGPCVMENNSSPSLINPPLVASSETVGDPRNTGYRRVENLFSEWQLSVYNHPELSFCQLNSFRACDDDSDCMNADGTNEGPCDVTSPFGKVITCQDCHMSNFPLTPLATVNNPYPGPGDDLTPLSKNALYPRDLAALEGSQSDFFTPLPVRRVSTHFMAGVDLPLVPFPGQAIQAIKRQQLIDASYKITLDDTPDTATAGDAFEVELTIENVGVGHRLPAGFSHERQNWVQMYVQTASALGGLDPFDPAAPCNLQGTIATDAAQADDPSFPDQTGAQALAAAGCVHRSGFVLDKGHPETGEDSADGSLRDEDPEDFFVVAGTRTRGTPSDPGDPTGNTGSPRIEGNPGADGFALTVQNICEEATAEAYLEGVRDGTGIDLRKGSTAPHQVRLCDPNLSPQIPGEELGFTAPGFGNPDCMEAGEDVGPCVPEIELSDGNERGRCAGALDKASCQSDADCGNAGPCLYRCSDFAELECCDLDDDPDNTCADFYARIGGTECQLGFEGPGTRSFCAGGANAGTECAANGDCDSNNCLPQNQLSICIGGPNSGRACAAASAATDCGGAQYPCGDVGECVTENRGLVNFQNQFRETFNGICVDPMDPRDAEGIPIPPDGVVTPCLLNLNCTLAGFPGQVCLVNGQCAADGFDGVGGNQISEHGDPCTNVTYRADCGVDDVTGDNIACNVERNLELNGRPSESVFIQNHPFNFNSLPPFQPVTFLYEFEVPDAFAGEELVVAARVMNRHFPMRFLRNLIGTQNVKPPFIVEDQGDPADPGDCSDLRTIDIDCFVNPVATLGNAERGGFVPAVQQTRTTSVTVQGAP
jgi:hypothetical protein